MAMSRTTKAGLRSKLIEDAVAGWKNSPPDFVREAIWRSKGFPDSMAKFGIEQAIRNSADQKEYDMRGEYWFGMSELGRTRLIRKVARLVEEACQ